MMTENSFEAVCRTYTKIMDRIADAYGIPVPDRRGRELIDCIMEQIASVVREQCLFATDEALDEAFKLAAAHMPGDEEVLYVPLSWISILAGRVGRIRVGPIRAFRPKSRQSA